MTEFLLFTIYAPLSSWGEIAVGETRGSWDRPSRSAVLGLVAAALGITRDDQPGHDALDAGYGVAVRLDAAGTPLSDYHTAQTVAASAVKRRRPATRAQLLDAGERETILSRRVYRQDALATVALWARPDARWPLLDLAAALRRPAFVLYAGRKANALGVPLAPSIVSAESLAAALGQRPAVLPGLSSRALGVSMDASEVAHDPCDGFPSGMVAFRRDVRRDRAAHRVRWQFAERTVEVSHIPGAAAPTRAAAPGARSG